MKIYGFDLSTWTNAVRFTANALDIDYEFVRKNLVEGEGQQPEYLAIHPAGKVPAMDDDGFRLFESGAIQRYLARKQGSTLYPTELQAQANVDQWSLFTSLHVGNAMGKVVFNRIVYQFLDLEQDVQSLEEGEKFLERFLPIIDTQLGKSTYLAADHLTIADLMLLAWLDPAEAAEVDLCSYGHIAKRRDSLRDESFYTDCHRDYAELLRDILANVSELKIDANTATA